MRAQTKRLILLLFYIFLLTIIFLSQSRYPRLNEKSLSGERVSIASPITHEALLTVNKSENFISIIFKEEINWLYTNMRGMIFGTLIAAAFMTLLQFVRKKNFKGHFLNSFMGVLIGAPLGICVNCATPVFQGLVKGGGKASFAITLMQSSPVLNFIVIGLSFSLFPVEFVLIKILFTLIYLLIILPRITKNLPNPPELTQGIVKVEEQSWFTSSFKAYVKNLVYLLKATIPLLLLAGLLGVSLVKIFPIDLLKSFTFDFKSIFLIAIVGTLLPVPMAMDAILTYILMNLGLPIGPGMTLFFCLGIFSIYPFFLIWKEYTVKTALLILITVMGLGIISGYMMQHVQEGKFSNTLSLITSKYQKKYTPDGYKVFSVIVESCSKQFKHKGKRDCQDRFLEKEVIFGIGPAICTYLLDENERKQCEKLKNYKPGNKKAVGGLNCIKEKKCNNSAMEEVAKLANPKFCNFFADKNRCRLLVAINKIKNGYPKSICNDLKTGQKECLEAYFKSETCSNREHCKEIEIYKKLRKNPDIKLCYKLGKARIDRCLIEAKNIIISREIEKVRVEVLGERIKKSKKVRRKISKPVKLKMVNITFPKNYNLRDIKKSKYPFEKYEGPELGIKIENTITPSLRYEPFVHSFPIASGDFNNDLYPDLAIGIENGIILAVNTGDLKFKTYKINLKHKVLLVALVDLNNDGTQDLYYSTYKEGSFYIPNLKGTFRIENIKTIGLRPNITMAASFGDIDRDGNLDVALGNWTIGTYGRQLLPFESSKNDVFLNTRSGFKPLDLSYMPRGETLTALFSDINDDNRIDLAFGNDFEGPDTFYLNFKGKKLKPIFNDGPIPISSKHTMSIDTADINNDLKLDVFSVDLDAAENLERRGENYCNYLKLESEIKKCKYSFNIFSLTKARDTRGCDALFVEEDKRRCLNAILLDLAIELKSKAYCEKISKDFKVAKDFCITATSLMNKNKKVTILENQIPQSPKNILLLGSSSGEFMDRTRDFGIENTGWSWNAKFADLNNDGFQDLYIANGMFNTNGYTPNQLFLNKKGKTFENISESSGLDDFVHTSSYTYADLDLDGDLDIVSTGLNAPLRVFINKENKNNSITFVLRNKKENRFNIGAKVLITYGDGKRQIREIKLGGGFQSFDNPMAHFGIGEHKFIKGIEIIWPSGKKEKVEKRFLAGKIYSLE